MDEPLVPLEQRPRVSFLIGDVVLRVVPADVVPRRARGETGVRPVGPLHRCADVQVIPAADHTDLLAVVDERYARQGHVDARGDPDPALVLTDHRERAVLVVVGEEGAELKVRVEIVDLIGLAAQPPGVTPVDRVEHGVGQLELEAEVEAVLGHILQHGARGGPRLADGQDVGPHRLDVRVVVLPELQRRRRVLELAAFLDDVEHGVEAEAVNADGVEPVGGRVEHRILHGRRLVVEVRHAAGEEAVVPARGIPVPDVLPPGSGLAQVAR